MAKTSKRDLMGIITFESRFCSVICRKTTIAINGDKMDRKHFTKDDLRAHPCHHYKKNDTYNHTTTVSRENGRILPTG